MKLGRWVFSSPGPAWSVLALAWLAACAVTAAAAVVALQASAAPSGPTPQSAEMVASLQADAPAADDPRWHSVALGLPQPGDAAWYRVRFDAAAADGFWMLYLPYFYGGGQIWLNGVPVAQVPQNSATLRVRWERPLLLPLPVTALKASGNLLLLRAAANDPTFGTVLPRLQLGPQAVLQPAFDRRLFVVRTVPVVTVVTGVVVGALVLLIWWRRRDEVLYGLFGLAALLWALRTTTFVFDTSTPAGWDAWRVLYFVSTGGFVIVMALFALALAGWSRPLLTRALLGYWALGPLAYLAGGEGLTARWWVAGLLPIGAGLTAVVFSAAWRQRSAATVAIALALAVALGAGLHDYLIAANSPLMEAWLPDWSAQRYFLLHHAANLLLVVMGVLLVSRFVGALAGLETANRTLEARVQERERQIAASYERIAGLQREQAATDERQRIMRDLHDGLGSQLFTSLSRAERGTLDAQAMTDTLRGAIDQMRVAIEALASEEQDFRTAFGNFRFRWDARLREAGLVPDWQLDLPDEVLAIAPHDALQILHIAQEALTNVLKHARAQAVTVRLVRDEGGLHLEVADDGCGRGPVADAASGSLAPPTQGTGRGQTNMRTRAQRLGGVLEVALGERGTRVSLRMPHLQAGHPRGGG